MFTRTGMLGHLGASVMGLTEPFHRVSSGRTFLMLFLLCHLE